MHEHALPLAPLVERYLSIRLDTDLTRVSPGEMLVVETPLRLTREESYSFIRAMWYLALNDGRRVVSVPPGAGSAIRQLLERDDCKGLHDSALVDELRHITDHSLAQAGLLPTDRIFSDLIFTCNRSTLILHPSSNCRRLTDTSVLPADGLDLPTHCFPDGLVYGVVDDDRVVSVAFAHRTQLMEDQIVDVGIETAMGYRRRGYAKTTLSALTAHITDLGGEGIYRCSPENTASARTAGSVGYQAYGSSLTLAAPCAD